MHSTAEPGRSASSSSSTSTSLLVASVIRHCRSSNQATGRSSCWREVACRSGLPAWQPSQACGAPRSRSLVPQCLLQHHRQASTVAACVLCASNGAAVVPSTHTHWPCIRLGSTITRKIFHHHMASSAEALRQLHYCCVVSCKSPMAFNVPQRSFCP